MSGLTCQKQLGAATAKDPSLVAGLVCRLSGLRQFPSRQLPNMQDIVGAAIADIAISIRRSFAGASPSSITKSAGSLRRALPGRVQIALKPASKGLGLHRVFIRGKGRMCVVADSAFKAMQVDARACWLDTDEHHRGLALRTSGALNCNEWNDGRQALRLGHDASLE
jgi:hypothetical protein